MGGRKKIVVLVGMAIACLTTLLLLLHDWNSEVNRLTARVERTTGLAIVTGGSARLTLLPPALMVENIVARQGDNPVAQIKRLSLQVSPLSLLTGQVQVNGLVVDHLRVGGASIDSLTLHVAPHKLEGFSKWNGHAVTFAASLSATDEQAAQFRLTIPTLNTALRFEGMVEKGPALSGHMVLNAGNLAGLLPDYALPPGRTLQAEADMDWGDGQFSLVNLTLQTGDTRAGGSLTLLAGSPALVDADLDVDSLNLESWQGAKSAALPALLPASLTPPANGAAKLAAGTETPAPASPLGVALPQDMLGNLHLRIGQLSWLGQTFRGLDLLAGLDQGNVVVRHAGGQWEQGLRADVDGVFEQDRFTGRLRLNGPGLSGRSDLSVDDKGLKLTNLVAKHDDLLIKGNAAGSWHDGLAAQWTGAIGTWNDTAASAKFVPQGRKLQMPELEARSGTTTLRGQAGIDFSAARPQVQAQLRAGDLNLAALPTSPRPAFVPPQPKLGGKAARRAAQSSAAASASKASASGKKGGSPFSKTALDWSGLNALDGQFDLSANSLSGSFGRLDQPQMKLVLTDGIATIEDLQAGFLDGRISAKGRISAAPQPNLQMDIQAKNADLARWRPGFAGFSLASGRANGHFSLKAAGRSSQDMAASAQGDGRFEAKDGNVDGIDLPAINAQLSNLRNIGNILALAQTGMKGGQTRFTSLSGTVKIADGTARLPDLALKAEGGSLAGDLSVALVPWTTDSSLSIALASLPATPLGLRLSGPMDKPRTVVDANSLQKALVQGGLGRALSGDNASGTDQQQPKGGRKILQNIFKALGGK
ncbi:MAG: AsmA family protein [Magnetospirillum sp.]